MTATWIKKANTLIPILEKRIQEMESSDSTQSNVPLDSAKIMQFKVMLQVYTAFKEWQERSGAGLMLTQHKLVIDLAIQNMDRPIHFSTTVGSSNFMGLEKYMVQEGLIYNFIKGDLSPRQNAFDIDRSGYLIDSVYKFRCLGDGSCYINTETERLLSSYTSLYLQIAFNLREQIVEIRKSGPYTVEKKLVVDEKLKQASHYLEKGIYQFPNEWRSYWAAAFVYEAAGQYQKAKEYLEKGLLNVPEYEHQGRGRLSMSIQSMQGVPDATPVMKIESQDSAQDTSISDSSTTKNQE
jgi:tetratricopeptide (TPR) repeat protein